MDPSVSDFIRARLDEFKNTVSNGANTISQGFSNNVQQLGRNIQQNPSQLLPIPAFNIVGPALNTLNTQNTQSAFNQPIGPYGRTVNQALQTVMPQVGPDLGNFYRSGYTNMLPLQAPQQVKDVTNFVGNNIGNAVQGFAGGINRSYQGTQQFNQPEIANKIQGAINMPLGLINAGSVGNPLFTAVNAAASTPNALDENDLVRRVSSGVMKGYSNTSGLAPNVPDQNISLDVPLLGKQTFDPAKAVGGIAGFIKNPANKFTSGVLDKFPVSVVFKSPVLNFIAKNGFRGGVENVVQNMQDLSTNISNQDKAAWMVQNFALGAVMNVGVGGLQKVGGKVAGKLDTALELSKAFDELKTWAGGVKARTLGVQVEQLLPFENASKVTPVQTRADVGTYGNKPAPVESPLLWYKPDPNKVDLRKITPSEAIAKGLTMDQLTPANKAAEDAIRTIKNGGSIQLGPYGTTDQQEGQKYHWFDTGTKSFKLVAKAKPIEVVPNVDTFISRSPKFPNSPGWTITEAKTGAMVSEGKTQQEAIAIAQKRFSELRGVTPQELVDRLANINGVSPSYVKNPAGITDLQSLYGKEPPAAPETQQTAPPSDIKTLDKPLTIYHGTSLENLASINKNGLQISPEGRNNLTGGGNYGVSYSLDKNVANKYAQQYSGGTTNLTLPKGTKTVTIDSKGAGIDEVFTYNQLEELKNKGVSAIIDKSVGQESEVRVLSSTGKTTGTLATNDMVQKPLESSLPPQVSLTTTVPQIPTPKAVLPIVSRDVPKTVSSAQSIPPQDPIQRIIQALTEAKPLEQKQGQIYAKLRSKQVGAIAGIGQRMGGESGFHAQLGQLKGEMPKVQFESIRKSLDQPAIDHLFNTIEQANISPFEKITAKSGLSKLLGAEGGAVPVHSELSLLNEIFPPEFMKAVMGKRPMIQKVIQNLTDALNVPRAIMATADFSAPLRQGAFLIGRPKEWIPAFGSMFKYAFSKKAYEGLIEQIKARPSYLLMRENKLAITDMGAILSTHEESFMSNLVESIPGFGKISSGSERAYSGFLNKLRADTFDSMLKGAKNQGLKTADVAPDLAKFINAATGRGDLGALNRAAPILNSVMFSPRLLASRLNLMNPKFYVDLNPYVRKQALTSLLTFAGTALSVITLAKLGGATVEADPRSADFGKIKVGNTRYDILAGFQQPIRLAAQLITGKIISTTTGKEITLGEGYKPMTRAGIVGNFLASKENPIVSFAMGLLQGTDNIGQPFEPASQAVSRFIPLVIQDVYDLAKERGSLLDGLKMAVPGVFGVGTMTYGTQVPNLQTSKAGKTTVKLTPTTGLAEDLVNKITGIQVSNIPQNQQKGIVQTKQQDTLNTVLKDKIKQQAEAGNMQGQGTYVPINKNGMITVIDTSFQPKPPTFTTSSELNKKAMSAFNGQITQKSNDIYDLYVAGKLTQDQANSQLAALKELKATAAAKSGTLKTKKPKKLTIKLPKMGKIPKIKMSRVKKLTLKKFNPLKVKRLKASKITRFKPLKLQAAKPLKLKAQRG